MPRANRAIAHARSRIDATPDLTTSLRRCDAVCTLVVDVAMATVTVAALALVLALAIVPT
jgi:hypothetical protein